MMGPTPAGSSVAGVAARSSSGLLLGEMLGGPGFGWGAYDPYFGGGYDAVADVGGGGDFASQFFDIGGGGGFDSGGGGWDGGGGGGFDSGGGGSCVTITAFVIMALGEAQRHDATPRWGSERHDHEKGWEVEGGAHGFAAVDDVALRVLVGQPRDRAVLVHARLAVVADAVRERLLQRRPLRRR